MYLEANYTSMFLGMKK